MRNHLDGVTVVPAGLAAESGVSTFRPGLHVRWSGRCPGGFPIRVEKLSDLPRRARGVSEAQHRGVKSYSVLREAEASGRLANVRQMVLEYHGWAGGKQVLGERS